MDVLEWVIAALPGNAWRGWMMHCCVSGGGGDGDGGSSATPLGRGAIILGHESSTLGS